MFVPLCIPAFSPFMAHHIISLHFRAGWRPKRKNFHFSRSCMSARRFFFRPATVSILMPLTFTIASLNQYTPKFSGVPQKLTWCQQSGLQVLWHLAIIWAIRKSFKCILQGVRFLLANHTLLSGPSETFSYVFL